MPDPDDGRLAEAASLILDRLAAHRRAEADLARRRTDERDRAHRLARSFDALVRALHPEEQVPLLRRRDAIEGRGAAPAAELGSTPVTSAILAWLAAQDTETVTVPALNEHLRGLGLAHVRTHAAITLGRYARHGIVSRVRRGVYRVNRYHPELMAMREG